MVNEREAKETVERAFANARRAVPGGPIVVVDEPATEKPYGYVFFVNTKRYIETGERRYAAIGAGPVIVDYRRCQIVMLPTYLDSAEAIAKYESGELGGMLIERL